MNKCLICGNDKNNKIINVKEMLIGLGDDFNYLECNQCNCLQLINIPDDYSKYYPSDYFSFIPIEKKINKKEKYFNNLFIKSNISYYTGKGNLFNKLICVLFPESLPLIKIKKIDREDKNIFNKKILDVGCGQGTLLKTLALSGFKNLYGVDPFINDNINYSYSDDIKINIYKNNVFALNEKYDIIIMNHSLEHMEEQEKVLRKIYELLNINGECIICMPTVSSYEYKKYKENWFELDAPRHIFLHSLNSINLLISKCGFKIYEIIYDSLKGTLASRLYKKGWNANKINNYLYSFFGILSMIMNRLCSKILNNFKKGSTIRIYIKKEY